MAITKTKYLCSLCQNEYDTLEEAEECEAAHKLPVSIKESRYYYGEIFPRMITVVFADGTQAKYMRGVG